MNYYSDNLWLYTDVKKNIQLKKKTNADLVWKIELTTTTKKKTKVNY